MFPDDYKLMASSSVPYHLWPLVSVTRSCRPGGGPSIDPPVQRSPIPSPLYQRGTFRVTDAEHGPAYAGGERVG